MAASVPLTHYPPGEGCACKLPQQLLDDVLGTLRTSAAPADLDTELVAEVLRGGAETVTEVGALLAGGHSIVDPAPKYGLAVVAMTRLNAAAARAAVACGVAGRAHG